MTPAFALLLALPALFLSAAPKPGAIEGRAADGAHADLVRQMKDRLRSDPETTEIVAQRILKSSLGAQLSESAEPDRALEDLKSWVAQNPESAAHLAIGFAKDDAAGNKVFENSLYKDMQNFLELNPDNAQGMYGRLKRASSFSRSLEQTRNLDNEDRQAVINALFEGVDSERSGKLSRTDNAGRWDAQRGIGPGGAPGPGGTVDASVSLYDRLGAANLTGYSPEVMTLQSELNRRKAPGAPGLVETGKLDYPTLRHPYYGLRYDIDRLDAAARTHRAWSLAKALGEAIPDARLKDAAVQRALQERAAGLAEEPAFARRLAAISKAEAALAAFDREAAFTKRKSQITRARLAALASLRQNAARWIAIAALEEMLQRLAALRGFLTQPLRAAVALVPVSEKERADFLNAGAALERELETALKKGARASALLGGDTKGWSEAQRLSNEVRAASKSLPAEIQRYRDAPLMAAEGTAEPSGWRAALDDLVVRWLPNLAYSRELKGKRARAKERLDAFRRIAGKSSR